MSFDTRNNSAMMKRAEQLKRWEESETNREPSVPKSEKGRKIKFSSGCVFLAACLAGDKEEVVNLIENGADINTANVDGLTALHQACIDDNLDMVEFLVEHGADINRQDNEGWTPLHATASCGFVSIARYLVEHGADISAVNSDGELAVDLAVDIAHLSPMIEYMQKLVAEHNIDCDKARRAEEEMMLSDAKRWLRSDASEADNPHPKTGATALHVAAAKGYKKVLSLLLAGRANVDKQDNDGWTPLHAAAHWGQKESAEMLVDALADMDVRNYAGQTCIDVAERKMVKFLEDLRANNKRMKRRPSSQISRISDTIENHIENTPTKFIRVEVKPDTKDPVNDDKPKLMPEKVNSETAIDEDAPWRRGSAARTRNQPESPPKNQVPEKDVKSTESDVILRRTQSFENDEKKPITSPPASPNTPVATPNSTAPTTPTTPNTTPIRRSFVPPVRDEESETQRKAHAKRVRETRRSTQGVTLDEIKSAEELVKKKNSTMNNNNNTNTESQNTTTTSSTTTTTTITTSTTTPSSPIKQQLPVLSPSSATSAIILATTTTAITPLESTTLTTTPTSPISPINDRVPSTTLDYESETVPPAAAAAPLASAQQTTTEITTKHSSNDEDEEEISATFTVAFNRTKPIHLTDDKIAEQIHSWSPTPPSTPPPIKSPTHTQPPPSITIEEHKDVEEEEEEEEEKNKSEGAAVEEIVEQKEVEEEKEKTAKPIQVVAEETEKSFDSEEEEESGATDEDDEESSTSEELEKESLPAANSPTRNANNKTEVCQKVKSEPSPTVVAINEIQEEPQEQEKQQPSSLTSPMHSPRMRVTNSSPTDSPTRTREKRSLFDIDNANSLSLAEKLRNEANKYTTEEIGEETKVPSSTMIPATVTASVTTTTTTPSATMSKASSSSQHDSDNSDSVVVMRKSESTPSSPLHMSSAAERRPSWRLKFDIGCKFKLEDASSGTTFPPNNSTIIPSAPAVIAAANLSSSIAQRRINTTNAMNTSNQQQSSMMRPVSAPVGSMGSTNSIASHDSSDRSRDSNTNNTENTMLSRRTNNGEDKENDKENDNRSALATQAVIQRRRKPKRRSTGVVHIDMDDLEPERQDSAGDNEEKESGNERSSRSRLGSTVSVATDTDISDTKSNSKDKTENGELIDYKALWEAAKLENDKLKQQLKKKDDEIIQARATVERFTNATTKNSLSEIEKRERRAMERKLSEMEEELKQLEVFKTENQRLKEENGALIRVISKLSK